MAIFVRRFAAHEWTTYRDLRLRALADTPDAFGSTFAHEAARVDDDWRDRLTKGARASHELPLIALSDDVPAGLAWARLDDQQPDLAQLYQVWVAPDFRGRGVGRRLVEAVVAWAQTTGIRVLRLGVTRGDSAAVRLYRRAGFLDVGDARPLRPGSHLQSQPMELVVTAGPHDRMPNEH
jgi:ribosomal protein S18 acetylase RimI-like enzyme